MMLWRSQAFAAATMIARTCSTTARRPIACHGQRMFETVNNPIMPRP